jgi:DNA polymerase III epsilon subunit-like protein
MDNGHNVVDLQVIRKLKQERQYLEKGEERVIVVNLEMPKQDGSDRKFLVLDVETGGVNPFKHSLLSVGMVAMEWDEHDNCMVFKDTLQLFVKSDIYNVTEKAMEINGINLDWLNAHGASRHTTAIAIQNFVKRNFGLHKPIVVGKNVGMDKYFVYKLLEECPMATKWDDLFNYRMIDLSALLLSMYYTGNIPKDACSNAGAMEYFHITNEQAHEALSDAIATAELFDELIYEFGGWDNWKENVNT